MRRLVNAVLLGYVVVKLRSRRLKWGAWACNLLFLRTTTTSDINWLPNIHFTNTPCLPAALSFPRGCTIPIGPEPRHVSKHMVSIQALCLPLLLFVVLLLVLLDTVAVIPKITQALSFNVL